jgi:hypothetical protein
MDIAALLIKLLTAVKNIINHTNPQCAINFSRNLFIHI